jgi:nicotinamide riboside kinase
VCPGPFRQTDFCRRRRIHRHHYVGSTVGGTLQDCLGSRIWRREYCEKVQAGGVDLCKYQWRSDEFLEIARKQQAIEDCLAREANRILIFDTDVLSTGIWHERYMKTRSPEIEGIAAVHRHDLYLLTNCDLPFVQDGLRDGESIREWMTLRFEQVLTGRGLPWVKISGYGSQRLEAAICEVDKLLA